MRLVFYSPTVWMILCTNRTLIGLLALLRSKVSDKIALNTRIMFGSMFCMYS